jgi:hypothetical protein
MDVLKKLKRLGGGAGGVIIYNAAKLAAEVGNSTAKTRKLKPDIILRLRPVFPHLNLKKVSLFIEASLPPNWFTTSNDVEGMTFGYSIYFKGSGYQTDLSKLHWLVHELAHVDQVRQRENSETQFARDYGVGYLQAGNYWDNPLEIEARAIEAVYLSKLRWADGSLLRENPGAIYVIYGSAKFGVPNMVILDRLFPNAQLTAVPDGVLANISNVPIDGTLLREENGAIWVIYGGAKYGVPDPNTYDRLYSGAVLHQLWDGALVNISDVPIDGTLLREENGGIWVIYGGAKFGVPDPNTYDRLYSGAVLHQLWDGALVNISDVPIDGTLLREENGAIWVIYGGAKFGVPNMVILDRLFPGADYHQVWNGALASISDVPIDGTLFREESSNQVYIIVGGKKRPRPSQIGPVHTLWDGALNQIP